MLLKISSIVKDPGNIYHLFMCPLPVNDEMARMLNRPERGLDQVAAKAERINQNARS